MIEDIIDGEIQVLEAELDILVSAMDLIVVPDVEEGYVLTSLAEADINDKIVDILVRLAIAYAAQERTL